MRDRGFWATLVGGSTGGGLGLFLGGLAGWTVLPELGIGSDEEFGDFYTVFAAAAVGAWLGSLGGAWLALRVMKDSARGGTIRWLAILAPPLVGGGSWLAVSLTDAYDYGSNFIPYVIFTTSVLATAFFARSIGAGADIRES